MEREFQGLAMFNCCQVFSGISQAIFSVLLDLNVFEFPEGIIIVTYQRLRSN